MASRQAGEPLMTSRSEIIFTKGGESDKQKAGPSQRKSPRPIRSASVHTARSKGTSCCSCCTIPLVEDTDQRDLSAKSRSSSAHLCKESVREKEYSRRTPSGRPCRSASINWTNMGEKIETWFEKARTPDQRVVYGFLEQLNDEQDKSVNKSTQAAQSKSLNDVLSNLKKYQARFKSPYARRKLSRAFESQSWRVLRHPAEPYEFSQRDAIYGDEATRNLQMGSLFTSTNPRIRSTFMIHPTWV